MYVKAAQPVATCSQWLSTLSTGGSCLLFCRPNLTDRGSCKGVPVPTPTTLLFLQPLCESPSRWWQMPSRRLILSQACPTTKNVIGFNMGIWLSLQRSEWVGTHVRVFRRMQIKDHAQYSGVEIWPGAADRRWNKERNKCVGVCARIRASSHSLVLHALSVHSFIGSVAEPDAATIAAETLALQRLAGGPFHSLPSALLRRAKAVDGILSTSKAARFRVASQSAVLSTGMGRIQAANDHCGRTLESVSRSWDEKYFHSATAYYTTAAFQLVSTMDSLRRLRNLPSHKMQSGAAALIRQSGNILDIATAFCSRSSCAIGSAVSTHS